MALPSGLVEFSNGRAPQGAVGLERLLRPACERPEFSGREVSLAVLEELHALMAVGPGMTGASPTRLLFVTTPPAKARLAQHLAPRVRDAALLAPACAIVTYDREFAEQLLAFVGDGGPGGSHFDTPGTLRAAALRNSVLQGAYLALSARALGLEAVFMHGFDGTVVAREFFRAPGLRATFVAALGYPLSPS